jgi:hypothetical protein
MNPIVILLLFFSLPLFFFFFYIVIFVTFVLVFLIVSRVPQRTYGQVCHSNPFWSVERTLKPMLEKLGAIPLRARRITRLSPHTSATISPTAPASQASLAKMGLHVALARNSIISHTRSGTARSGLTGAT